MKVCVVCSVSKPNAEFSRNRTTEDGYQFECKLCRTKAGKEWYRATKERVLSRSRRNRLKRVYGITEDQYDELFQRQNGCCAVCKRPQADFKIRFAVDHLHKDEGWIRGLLCYVCNRHLIGRHTDPELFRSAAAYLEQHTEWKVPIDYIKPKRRRKKRRAK